MKTSKKSAVFLTDALKKNFIFPLGIIVCIVFSALLSSVMPIFFQRVIDNLARLEFPVLALYVVIIMIIPVICSLLDIGKTKLSFMLTNKVGKAMREALYDHLLNIKMREFSKDSVQGFLATVTRSVGKICDVLLGQDVLNFIANTVQIITVFLFLLALDWRVTLGCLVVTPILFFVIKSQRVKVDQKQSELLQVLLEGENLIVQTLKNMKIVRMFSGKDHERERFSNWNDKNISTGWSVRFTHAMAINILPRAVEQLMYGIVFVFCIVTVKRGAMTAGTLVAVLSYVPLFYRSMSGLLSVQIGLSAAAKPMRDLDQLFALKREEGMQALSFHTSQASNVPLVQFRDVFFTYGRVPCNVSISNLSINLGELIVIVGESGGGKTTIFDLICKFFDPIEGSILFMGKNIQAVRPDDLRKHISLMPQESLLWDGSIRSNICYPEQTCDEKKLHKLVQDTALSELYERLDASGSDTIGESGSHISGGEKQRVSVARAMNRDALLYLFDEPTSLMDSITAESVFHSILAMRDAHKAILVVTHNLAHAQYADRVLVFKGGRIEGFDTYENLLTSCNYFSSLVKSHSNHVEGEEVTA